MRATLQTVSRLAIQHDSDVLMNSAAARLAAEWIASDEPLNAAGIDSRVVYFRSLLIASLDRGARVSNATDPQAR